ncbi:hypothetical protein ACFQY7_42740 [Actinomadura luteofluorescens]|uniref:hypothetical protein n=1 Tax=Actinomadura luteofluorescens TaxID=46163 RepID=UPI00363EA034
MYERFAHEYASHAEDSSYNAFYDRPAVLGLAGDVATSRSSTPRAVQASTRENCWTAARA